MLSCSHFPVLCFGNPPRPSVESLKAVQQTSALRCRVAFRLFIDARHAKISVIRMTIVVQPMTSATASRIKDQPTINKNTMKHSLFNDKEHPGERSTVQELSINIFLVDSYFIPEAWRDRKKNGPLFDRAPWSQNLQNFWGYRSTRLVI